MCVSLPPKSKIIWKHPKSKAKDKRPNPTPTYMKDRSLAVRQRYAHLHWLMVFPMLTDRQEHSHLSRLVLLPQHFERNVLLCHWLVKNLITSVNQQGNGHLPHVLTITQAENMSGKGFTAVCTLLSRQKQPSSRRFSLYFTAGLLISQFEAQNFFFTTIQFNTTTDKSVKHSCIG